MAVLFVLKTNTATQTSANPHRVDRWLWSVRACKTRAIAAAACRNGRVRVDDVVAKPARELKVGETVTLRSGPDTRILVVRDFPASRVGAKLVSDYCDDRTPPKPKPTEAAMDGAAAFVRERGAGRPTKRDRRKLLDILEGHG